MELFHNNEVVKAQMQAMLLINPRPSEEEYTKYSFPSKNMEYMVSGRPTLTTYLQGMPKEYLNYVYVIENETEIGIADMITKIVNKSKLELSRKGREAQQFVLVHKNNISQAKKLESFLDSVLNS